MSHHDVDAHASCSLLIADYLSTSLTHFTVCLQALRSNPRIDGLYLYVSTSSPQVLAQRQKQRLSEAASTLDKRLAWAKQQVAKSGTAGLFDNVIPNGNVAEVCGLVLLMAESATKMFLGHPATSMDLGTLNVLHRHLYSAARAQPLYKAAAAVVWSRLTTSVCSCRLMQNSRRPSAS